MYDCSIRGGGAFFMLSNVLDTKGEGVTSNGGDVFGFWGTKTRFLVGYIV